MKKEGGGGLSLALKYMLSCPCLPLLPKTIRAFLKTHSTFIHKNAVWTI